MLAQGEALAKPWDNARHEHGAPAGATESEPHEWVFLSPLPGLVDTLGRLPRVSLAFGCASPWA